MHQFHKFILAWNSTCFRQFLCPIIKSLVTVHSALVYVLQVSISSIQVLLENCLQTCVTYIIAECTVNKLLMMGSGTVRNM
jgi:hypothetical protein